MEIIFGFAGGGIQLVPDGTLIFHLILIAVMVAVLNATLLKPINRILEERDRQTRGRLSEAGETMARVERRMREYESRLREARAEGYSLIERERSALSTERDQQLAQLRSEIAELLKDEKERLASESEQVRETLKTESQGLAREISQHILQRPIGGQPYTNQGGQV
jgi:F-type H+-transporting ATPase subunit b